MTGFRAAFLVAPFLLLMTALALAQDVTLSSRDGSVRIDGTLLSYDGEFYRVASDYGTLTLDGTGVVCEGPGCPDLTAYVAHLRFSGSRSMGEVLMPALVEGFAIRNGFALRRIDEDPQDGRFTYEFSERQTARVAARFEFRLTDAAEGFADLLAQDTDIVLSRREATADEARMAREAGIGDLLLARHARIVGLDALVPLVPISNRAPGIGMEELLGVLSGEIRSWAHFGGPDEPISVHLPAAPLGLERALATGAVAELPLQLTDKATRHPATEALAAAVAADPFALGLGVFSRIDNAEALPVVGPCGIPAIASPQSLKTEDYPLTAPLFVYTPARRLPRIAREFLAFLTAPAAQPIVRRAGFVDQFPESVPLDRQGLRLAAAIEGAGGETSLADLQRMVRTMAGLSRLTVTFRFEGGSSEPDAQSRSNVQLLAEALEQGVFDDRRLVFVGFSDGQGPASLNARLALDRARAVRDAVALAAETVDRDRVRLDIDAFGEAMPMACDEVEWGRRINRRVEVWLD